MDAKTHITREQLDNRFSYHAPNTDEKVARHQGIRNVLLASADTIVELTGAPTREQSIAITKLEEAMFWANAAIARNS